MRIRFLNTIIFVIISTFILAGEPVYFAQVTDLHFGAEANFTKAEKKESSKRLDWLVSSINEISIPLEFLVLTGDITDKGFEENEFVKNDIEVTKKINKSLNFIPGNHDISQVQENVNEDVKKYISHLGEISYTKEIKGIYFIFFYGEPIRNNVVIEGYDPFKWLEEKLNESGGKPVIIFAHSVPGKSFYENKWGEMWPIESELKFEKMILKYNVKAIIGGHEHSEKIRKIGNTFVFVEPNFVRYDNMPASYRVYEYNNGEIPILHNICNR